MFSWRAGAALAGVLSGALLLAITAQAADLSIEAFPAQGCPQAVDGFNANQRCQRDQGVTLPGSGQLIESSMKLGITAI
jgi:hypothetical protein